jgi:deoxyribonuclease-4
LGLQTFRKIVQNPLLRGLPMILETPNDLPGYEKEIALLRSME